MIRLSLILVVSFEPSAVLTSHLVTTTVDSYAVSMIEDLPWRWHACAAVPETASSGKYEVEGFGHKEIWPVLRARKEIR